MTTKLLLPQTFWFRFALPCRKWESMALTTDSGRLIDLPEAAALPDMHELDGQPSWAQVRVGWNLKGLGITVVTEGDSPIRLERDRPEGFALVQFWVDTRDTRNVSRATRFCHRFVARLDPAKARGELKVQFEQKPIARAIADPPMSRADVLDASARISQTGWLLDVFLPAEALHGFDPETNRRLGFAYQVSDYIRDDQFLGVGREFPVGENPSLWATLELRDDGAQEPVTRAMSKKKRK
jgi:hypothetical protein